MVAPGTLPYRLVQIPFSAGLQTKHDPRSLQEPYLDICRDGEFDNIGGIQLRKPFNPSFPGYAVVQGSPAGETQLQDVRRLIPNGNELLCLTKTGLYSFENSAAAQGWIYRSDHVAAAIDEQPTFATTDDQIDADRAELNGVVFYAWNGGGNLYVAAKDKATGAVLAAPTILSGSSQTRPRLVALQTQVLLLEVQGGNTFFATALHPQFVTASINGGAPPAVINVFGGTNQAAMYDVVAIPGTDTCAIAIQHTGTTSYDLAIVASPGAPFGGNPTVVVTANKARTCDGPIAISPSPNGTTLQVVRGQGTTVKGDLVNITTLADVFTAQAIGSGAGTPINQIAACHRNVKNSSHYRCYVFWSSAEANNNSAGFDTHSNWVDDNNTLGTQAMFVPWVGVGSRAITYNGSVYVWLTFGQVAGLGSGSADVSATGQFQNAYFLYRDDGTLFGKCIAERGGGLCPTQGRVPGVVLTAGSTTFMWMATQRRIIDLGSGGSTSAQRPNAGYAMREPVEVTFNFDDNNARRAVRLGNTQYLAAGEILQYDGSQLSEVGFHIFPWYFDALIQATGNIANGSYGYKSTYRWQNAQGELDRSTTATVATALMTGGPSGFTVETISLPITHKSGVADEIWRTVANPTADAPFFLITSNDPSVTSNPNRYLPNAISAGFNPTVHDIEVDAVASTNQADPETGGILEALAPPAAKIIIASQDRLFLGAVAGYPDTIWYSKQRDDGEVAAFNDALTAPVPKPGGTMTALMLLEGTLIASRQRAIYRLPGDGFDNTGGGNNYGPAQIISTDIGATNADAWALYPDGVFFKSNKGWYSLGKDWTLKYLGAGVSKFDSENVLAVHCVESQHQIRCVTDGNHILVYDYLVGEWAEWTVPAVHACMWNGQYIILCSTGTTSISGGAIVVNPPPPPPGNGATSYVGPMQQSADFSIATGYGLDVETAWIPLSQGGLQGRGYVMFAKILGEYRSSHKLQIRCARNYKSDGAGGWTYFDNVTWPVDVTTVGDREEVRHGPSIKQGEAFKIRITALAADGVSQPQGESVKLTSLTIYGAGNAGLFQEPVSERA